MFQLVLCARGIGIIFIEGAGGGAYGYLVSVQFVALFALVFVGNNIIDAAFFPVGVDLFHGFDLAGHVVPGFGLFLVPHVRVSGPAFSLFI